MLATIVLVAAGAITAVTLARPSDHQAASTPTTEPTSSAPAVPMSALPGLLLSAQDVSAIVGAPMNPDNPVPFTSGLGTDSDYLAEKDCAEPWSPAQKIAYVGSGWQAAALQSFTEAGVSEHFVPAGLVMPRRVIQGVVSFPAAELATKFLTGQKTQWAKCASRTVTGLPPGEKPSTISLGPLTTTADGTLTMPWSMEGTMDNVCVRALAVRNNIAIDTEACNKDSAVDQALDIVNKIGAKITRG